MDTIFIKTHQPGAHYAKPHFFVLSKGLNSGKPSTEPFTNSFVLVFQTEAQKEDIFWIAMSLWKSKFWMPFLRGSVIPFLSLYEFKSNAFNARTRATQKKHSSTKAAARTRKPLQQKHSPHQRAQKRHYDEV